MKREKGDGRNQPEGNKAEVVESQPPQRTADQVITDQRCIVPRDLYDRIQVIASENKMLNCEVQLGALSEFVDRYQLR